MIRLGIAEECSLAGGDLSQVRYSELGPQLLQRCPRAGKDSM